LFLFCVRKPLYRASTAKLFKLERGSPNNFANNAL